MHSNNIDNDSDIVDSPSSELSLSSPISNINMRSSSNASYDVLSLVFTPQWHQSDFKGNILPSRVSLWLSNPHIGASSSSGVLQAGAPLSLEFYAFCSPTTNQSKKFVKMADVSMFDASRDQMNDNCVSRCEPSHWIDTVNVSPLQRVEAPATGATAQMNFLLYRSKSEGRTNQLAYVKLYPGNKYKLEIRISRGASDDDSKTERLASFDGPEPSATRGFDVATLASRGFSWHMGHARMVRSGNGSTESQGNIDESLINIDSAYLNGKSWDKYNFGHHTSSLPPLPLFERAASRDTFSASMLPAALEIPVMTGQPMAPAPMNAGQWNFHTPFTQPTYTDGTKEEKKNTFDLPSPAAAGSGRSFLTLPSPAPVWPATSLSGDSTSSNMETRRNKRKAAAPVPEVSSHKDDTTPHDVDAPFAFKKNKHNTTEFMMTAPPAIDDCPVTPTTPSGHSISSTSTTGEVDRMTYGLEEFVFATIQQQAQEELEAMRRHQQREEAELLTRLRQRHQAQELEFHARQRRSLIQTMLKEMGRVDPSLAGMTITPSANAQLHGQRTFAPVSVDSLLQPDASVAPSPRGHANAPVASSSRRMVRASKPVASTPPPPPQPVNNTPTLMSTRSSTRAHHAAPAAHAPQAMSAPPAAAARPAPIAISFPSPSPPVTSRGSPMDNTIDGVTTPIPSVGGLHRLLSSPDEWGSSSSGHSGAGVASTPSFFDGLPLADDTLVFV